MLYINTKNKKYFIYISRIDNMIEKPALKKTQKKP